MHRLAGNEADLAVGAEYLTVRADQRLAFAAKPAVRAEGNIAIGQSGHWLSHIVLPKFLNHPFGTYRIPTVYSNPMPRPYVVLDHPPNNG